MAGVSTYNKDIGVEFCGMLCSSEDSIEVIAKNLGVSGRTVFRWIANNPEFADMYDAALKTRAFVMAERTLEIADTPSRDLVDAQDRKLRVNTRQWLMAKYLPKVFGDNKTMDMTIKVPKVVSEEQYNQLRAELAQKQLARPVEDIEHEEL